jgi:hypothetical protein
MDPHPLANGAGLAFYELQLNGRRLVTHGGFTPNFCSQVVLFPEANVGLFIAINSGDAVAAIHWVIKGFMNRYYPGRLPRPTAFTGTAPQHAGAYMPTTRSYSKNEKALYLFDRTYETRVRARSARKLHMTHLAWDDWEEIRPNVFRQEGFGGQEVVVFSGRHLAGAINPFGVWERLAFHQMPGFHRSLWRAFEVIFAVLVAGILLAAALGPSDGWASWSGNLVAVLAGVFGLAGLSDIRRSCEGGSAALLYGFPPAFRTGLMHLQVAAVLGAGVTAFALLSWPNQYWTSGYRVVYSLFAVAMLVFLWSMAHWNLIGRKPT